ncbi:MAG: FAD binding domain-containing protein [Alphaproteobacteria bacterium]|nr:FAD binding domain-containing protein [Alphaproteobacteria bacterium]
MAQITRAISIADARAAMAAGARPAAGMTLLALEWHAAPPQGAFCDISAITALRGIAPVDAGLRIGALTSLEAMRRDPSLRAGWPAITALLDRIGGLGVRAQGTLGGNLGWGAGDLAPVMLAADARVQRDAGLIESVTLPRDGFTLFAEKIGHREAFSPTLITIAGAVQLAGTRIAALRLAVGGGPTAAQRLPQAEAALLGADVAQLDWRAEGARIAATIAAGTDALASAAHRARVAGRALAYGLAGLA